jgi:hypothetical protein
MIMEWCASSGMNKVMATIIRLTNQCVISGSEQYHRRCIPEPGSFSLFLSTVSCVY